MALSFPSSPSNGDTVTAGNITWTFNSSKGVWQNNVIGLSGASITIAADSGSDDLLTLGEDTLRIAGGTGLTSTVSDNQISIALDNTAVSAGQYGASNAIPQITVDAQGRVTSIATVDNTPTAEIGVEDSIMAATEIVSGTAYVIKSLGNTNWVSLGATSVTAPNLVNGTQYVITAIGNTTNWTAVGADNTPAVGEIFTANTTGATGNGTGTALQTAFTASGNGSGTGTVMLNSSHFVTFVDSRTGTSDIFASSAMTYNPGTNTFQAGNVNGSFSGSFSGEFAGTFTGVSSSASVAQTISIVNNAGDDESMFLILADGNSGVRSLEGSSGLFYNPNTTILTSPKFAGALTGNVTGQVSTLTNHDTSSLSEDSSATVTSGTMYYTDARVATKINSYVTGSTGITVTNGSVRLDNTVVTAGNYGSASIVPTYTVDAQGRLTAATDVNIAISHTQVTDFDTEGRALISVTDSGGDGSLAYDNSTGVITYTGPSASETRAHITGGTGVTITNGSIAIGQSVATTADVEFNQVTAALVGNASTATSAATLTTARNIGGVSFDGSGSINLPGVNLAGNQDTTGNAATATTATTAGSWTNAVNLILTGAITGTASVQGTGNVTLNTSLGGTSGTVTIGAGTDSTQDLSFSTSGARLDIDGTANEIDATVSKTGEVVTVQLGLPSDVTIGNNLSVTNDFSVATNKFTVDGTTGNTIIAGNLTIQGTTTTVDSNTVNIGDNIIVLNADEDGTPSQNAGIEIERGTQSNASFLWDEANDYWTTGSSHGLNVPSLTATNIQGNILAPDGSVMITTRNSGTSTLIGNLRGNVENSSGNSILIINDGDAQGTIPRLIGKADRAIQVLTNESTASTLFPVAFFNTGGTTEDQTFGQASAGTFKTTLTDADTLKYQPSTGTLYASNFSGNVAGSSSSASTVSIGQEFTSSSDHFLTFVNSSDAGNRSVKVDSLLKFVPGTNTLYSTNFDGALSGNATTASTLASARTITLGGSLTGNVSFDGSADVTLNAAVTGIALDNMSAGAVQISSESFADNDSTIMTSAAIQDKIAADIATYNYSTTTGTVTSVGGGAGLTGSITTTGSLAVGAGLYITVNADDIAVDATSANTASKVVARDGSGDFSAGTITASLTGNVTGNVTGNISGSSGTVSSLSGLSTADLSENTNLYYTDARVIAEARALLEHSNHVGSSVAFDSTSNELEITVTSSSNLSLQDAANANSSHFLTFAGGATGSEAILTDSGLTYNPSTNILSATSFSGGWSGTTIPVTKGGTGLTSVAANQIIYTTGSNTFGASSISAFGRSIIDDADASAVRTTLGIGSIATQSHTSVNIDGGTIDGTPIGATSAATGNFTTIGATGTITGNLSGNVTGNVSGSSGSTTGNAATATALASGRNFSITGDVTASAISFNGTSAVALNTTLATTMDSANAATTPGTFGSGTTIPQITVDAKGRITSVATVAASSSSSQTISDGTNTDAVTAGTDTLTFSGGEGVTTAVTNNTVTISAELATASNKGVASFDTTNFSVSGGAVTINPERVQDIVGAMVGGSNSESGISVTYDDVNGELDFNVDDFVLTVGGQVAGTVTVTNLQNASLNLQINDNAVALGTKTTGNYVATIADAGNSHITVTNSGSESAAVTLNIADSAIDTDQIATDAVTLGTKTTGNYVATIADAGNSAITVANSGTETAAVTLDIAAEGVGTTEIENLAVTSAKLADDAVTNAKLDSTTNFEAVNSDVIRAGAVTTVKIADDAVTSAKLDTNIQIAGNLTVDGNLTVSGTRVQVDVETLSVEDSLIDLARNNNAGDAVDIGLYGLYDTTGSQDLYGGLFRDASDSGKWKLFKDLQTEPTSTVLVTGTGYTTGTLVANVEGNVTGDVTGAATKVTVIADNNTNSTNNITFVNAASGDRQVRTDNQLTYNPSTGTLAAGNIQGSLFGNLVGNVTGNISGNVTGTITGDTSGNSGTATALQNSRNFTVGSTDVGFDGTADADLTEAVQDTVGAMFSSNTENGVTVTYADIDGTIDLTATALYNGTTKQLETTSTGLQVFGHIIPDTTEVYDLGSPTKRFRKGYFDAGTIFLGTQELTADSTGISVSGNFTANNITGTLTGNATGTASSLATSRNINIGSVSHAFDGSADVDLTEAIQDTVGTMFTSNTETGITATYQDSDGTIDLVVTAASSAGGVTSGGSVVTTSDNAPSSPSDGALWFDTTGLKMYVYYADGSSSQWVESTPGAGAVGAAAVNISETGPSTPAEGALWFDPSNLTTYIYYNDGNSSQWVELTPAPAPSTGSAVVRFAEQTSSATLVAGNKKIVDTSSSAITLTLPTSASIGDEVHIIDGTGNASTNNITIARNGHKIQGAAENLVVSTDRAAFQLVYYNANNGWVLINR